MYIFSLLRIWISFLHLGNPLFCECQWQPSPIYHSRGPKVWSCPCSPPAALWLKPSWLDALPVTLIRNGFHKEAALVWGCPWWQGKKHPASTLTRLFLEISLGPGFLHSLLGSCLFSKPAFFSLLIDSVRNLPSLFCCPFCDKFSLNQILRYVTLNPNWYIQKGYSKNQT